MKRALIAVGVFWLFLLLPLTLAATATAYQIGLPFSIRSAPAGSELVLFEGALPGQGELCVLTASDAGNNTSVHLGNNIYLADDDETVTFHDVERAPNVSTPGDQPLTPSGQGRVVLVFGGDGIYSADLVIDFVCEEVPPSTTSTTTTSTTIPPTTTTSSTVPPSSTTTIITTTTVTTSPPSTTSTTVPPTTTTTPVPSSSTTTTPETTTSTTGPPSTTTSVPPPPTGVPTGNGGQAADTGWNAAMFIMAGVTLFGVAVGLALWAGRDEEDRDG